MPVDFVKINMAQLQLLDRESTVFFFPVGPIEDHGPHLPLSLDVSEATQLCFSTAQRLEKDLPSWTGVLMPSVPLGIDCYTNDFALTVRPHVLRDWLVDACRSLIKQEFIHFVCFSGHLGPRQLTAIEEAGHTISRTWRKKGFFSRKPKLISASSAFVTLQDVLKSPFWANSSEHGGKRDTSVALAIMENEVHPSYIYLSEQFQPKARLFRKIKSYWGSPSQASQEVGRKDLTKKIDFIFPKLRMVLEGKKERFFFKSGYSFFPHNWSFFKSWVLLFCILLVLSLWAILNSFNIDI